MADEEFHPKHPEFKFVGHVDVDAGSIWVGDGCYVLKDKDEARPKDFGDDWHGICNRFFERSGYDAHHEEFRKWHEWAWRDAWHATTEFEVIRDRRPEKTPEDEKINFSKEDEIAKTAYGRWIKEWVEAERAFAEKWRSEHPFTPTVTNTGVASFKHDLGHDGMGLMISTNYGDGSYPVYIKYGTNGRPSQVLIDFYGEDDDDEYQEAAE